MTDNTVTISWVALNGDYVELDVPADVAGQMARGETVSWRGGAAPRRYDGKVAIAALRASQDQILERMRDIQRVHGEHH